MAFVAIIPSKDLPTQEAKLSFQLILLPSKIGIDLSDLYFNDLWLAISYGHECYLWCRLFIVSTEGLYEQDSLQGYLLNGDIDSSDYFCRNGQKIERLRIDNESWFNTIPQNSVAKIGNDVLESLQRIIDTCSAIRVMPPNEMLLAGISQNVSDIPASTQFRNIKRQLKTQYTISDLYKYSKYAQSWSPYEGLAFFQLERQKSSDMELLTGEINLLHSEAHVTEPNQYLRSVDMVLKEVHPDEIRVRHFINPPSSDIDSLGLDHFLKTERAEETHQRMVADLALRISTLGLTPYETNSIDLFAEGKNGTILIEVKSATPENFYRQCLKGAIQSKEYAYNLKTFSNIETRSTVIIQNTKNSKLQSYCQGLLKYMDVDMLSYHKEQGWPSRVVDFDKLIASIK